MILKLVPIEEKESLFTWPWTKDLCLGGLCGIITVANHVPVFSILKMNTYVTLSSCHGNPYSMNLFSEDLMTDKLCLLFS